MREVHQQDWLQLDEFPREGFKTVCFHALDLITQNWEYLEDHLRKHWKDQQSLDALADLQTAVSQLEGALGEMMALLDCISSPLRWICAGWSYAPWCKASRRRQSRSSRVWG